jgi:hypothetical protein
MNDTSILQKSIKDLQKQLSDLEEHIKKKELGDGQTSKTNCATNSHCDNTSLRRRSV